MDPGLRGSGVAIFCNGGLVDSAYVVGSKDGFRPNTWVVMASEIMRWCGDRPIRGLACELPQIYREAKLKGDPNDLMDLAAVVGALCALIPTETIRIYLPREWKGQVPKEIVHQRVKQRLSIDEMTNVHMPPQKSLAHNVWDAIGIGLVHVKRM